MAKQNPNASSSRLKPNNVTGPKILKVARQQDAWHVGRKTLEDVFIECEIGEKALRRSFLRPQQKRLFATERYGPI